jgi:hypothetical protein
MTRPTSSSTSSSPPTRSPGTLCGPPSPPANQSPPPLLDSLRLWLGVARQGQLLVGNREALDKIQQSPSMTDEEKLSESSLVLGRSLAQDENEDAGLLSIRLPPDPRGLNWYASELHWRSDQVQTMFAAVSGRQVWLLFSSSWSAYSLIFVSGHEAEAFCFNLLKCAASKVDLHTLRGIGALRRVALPGAEVEGQGIDAPALFPNRWRCVEARAHAMPASAVPPTAWH